MTDERPWWACDPELEMLFCVLVGHRVRIDPDTVAVTHDPLGHVDDNIYALIFNWRDELRAGLNGTEPYSQWSSYRHYLRSPDWALLSDERLAIDAHRCVACGSTQGLWVAHLHYKTVFEEVPADDLVTLCEACTVGRLTATARRTAHPDRHRRPVGEPGQMSLPDQVLDPTTHEVH